MQNISFWTTELYIYKLDKKQCKWSLLSDLGVQVGSKLQKIHACLKLFPYFSSQNLDSNAKEM